MRALMSDVLKSILSHTDKETIDNKILEFNVGKVKGSCLVYYEAPQYEPPNMIQQQYMEFTHVDVNNKLIPFDNINDVLFGIMEQAFEQSQKDYLIYGDY
jgi:hypothetical protein